jgi:hypothetical protein
MAKANLKRKRGKGPLALSTKAKRIYEAKAKGTKPGTGERFKAMVEALKMKGAKSPEALAAWVGRRKYGKQFQKMAVAGRKRAKGGK